MFLLHCQSLWQDQKRKLIFLNFCSLNLNTSLFHSLCKFLSYPKKNVHKYTPLSYTTVGQRVSIILPLQNFINTTYMFCFISGETFFPVSRSSHLSFSPGIALHASSLWGLPFSTGYCRNIYNQSKVVSQEHSPYTWVSSLQIKRPCQQLFVPQGKNLKLRFISISINKRYVTTAPFCRLTVSAQRQL